MRKDSPNLYEILKTATGAPPQSPPEVQPRPVAVAEPPPTPKPAPAVVEAPPPKPPTRVVVPSRPVAADPSPPPPKPGFGDRTLTFSLNTVIFAGLVALGVIFLAFAIGQRMGRAKGRAEAQPVRAPAGDTRTGGPESAPSGRTLSIKLMEWSGATTRDFLSAEENAAAIKKTLAQNGHPQAWYAESRRGDKRVMILYYGKYEGRTDEARERLAALKKFKYNRATPFSGADFVEVDP